MAFALTLLLVAGADVVLLKSLAAQAKETQVLTHEHLFSGQLSLMLYLLPAAFAGLGINLVSHVLINHLNEAEAEFDVEESAPQSRARHWLTGGYAAEAPTDKRILIGCGTAELIIFVLDLLTGSEIRLHVLYIFPLAVVAQYSGQPKIVFIVFALTSILQVVTFAMQNASIATFITDVSVSISASLLIIYLATKGRQAYLTAEDQATHDSLTSLPNRRAFINSVDAEIARQKRYGGNFSIAAIDLDGFKQLNDTQGHAAGDEALRICADAMRECTRRTDSIARIGGDEFAVLMPNLVDDIGFASFDHLCNTIAAKMSDAGFAVTASIGCKSFNIPPDSTSCALQQVDEVMYQAKHSGKNQVVIG